MSVWPKDIEKQASLADLKLVKTLGKRLLVLRNLE